MSRKILSTLGILAFFACAALGGCARRYAGYSSLNGDFRCLAPWGWTVLTDHEGLHYTDTTFIGPFDSNFYLGAPSLTIRWYRDYAAHQLRDGSLEIYADANDYIAQTLRSVYGPDYQLARPMDTVMVSGFKAKHFVVLSAAPAPPGARWGIMEDALTKKRINPRKHAYVVLPLKRGFYVLIYPATDPGYASHLEQFNTLVNTFLLLKDGPDGGPIRAEGPTWP
ncbi:MAG: hypothetical protein ACYCPQ_02605 [Elusimicrobiota bacterium]